MAVDLPQKRSCKHPLARLLKQMAAQERSAAAPKAIKRYPAGKPGGSGGAGGYTQVLAAPPTHTESPDTAREAAKARKKFGDENSVDGVLGGAMMEVVTHMDVVVPLT
jgi:hypothetical protein